MSAARKLLPLAMAAFVAAAAAAAPIPVSVDVKPEEITVGDRVTVQLTLVWDGEAPAGEPVFPAWEGTWGEAEVLWAGAVETSTAGGRRVYVQSLVLTAFSTGEVVLPQASVLVPLAEGLVEVPVRAGVGFTVRSVLPQEMDEGEKLQPRDPAPLRPLDAGWRSYATNGALALLCLLTAGRLASRLRKAPAVGAGGRRLLSSLEELLGSLGEVDSAASEPAHTAMSLALRRFLGRRLDMNAVESTTSEIQRRLHGASVASEQAQRVVAFLRQCDQVKFARQDVGPAVTAERLAEARRLGEEIEELLRPRDLESEDAGEEAA